MARLAQLLRQSARDPLPPGRGDPGTDQGDAGMGQQPGVAQGPKQGRGRIDGCQHPGIVRIAENDQPCTEPLARLQFGLDLFDPRHGMAMGTTAPDKIRKGLEGPLR